MLALFSALVAVDQNAPANARVDVKHLLPSGQTVSRHIRKLASRERETDKTSRLPAMLSYGGGVVCDGLKKKRTDEKLYDFSTQWVSMRREPGKINADTLELRSRSLFLQAMDEGMNKSAASIRSLLSRALQENFSLSFNSSRSMRKRFTLVTD